MMSFNDDGGHHDTAEHCPEHWLKSSLTSHTGGVSSCTGPLQGGAEKGHKVEFKA